MANRRGKSGSSDRFYFLWLQKSLWTVTVATELKDTIFEREAMTNLGSVLKSRHHFVDKVLYSKSCGFSSSHVWMWELAHKEGWVPKNWCFRTVVLEKTLESPLDCRSNQSILKEINTEYSLEGLMLKLKFQHFGHLMWRTDSLEKTLMLGKIEGRRRGW